jgi:hypothetical protein
VIGLLDEPTINFVFGRVLRRRRRVWEKDGVLQVQPLRALRSKKRPDILIVEAGRDPVVIETEVTPASNVEQDARARLNARTATGDIIYTAIAVCLPNEWRMAPNEAELEAAIENAEVEWVVWSLGKDGNPERWPRRGWIRSGVTLLAFAAYQGTLAHHRVRAASDALYEAVSAAGRKIAQLESAGYGYALRRIAGILLQEPSEQTFGMAALILANALVFHELLAGRGNLAHIPTLATLKWRDSGSLRKDDVVGVWNQILAVNYMPIFAFARDILVEVPDFAAQKILTDLYDAVGRTGLCTLLPRHDVLSETFQRMIADRKKLASFYTLPETTALLAGLALTFEQVSGGRIWSDIDGLKSIVIADFACGTGMLLSAAYRRMAWLYECAGGDSASLHSAWMENSMLGIDVLPAAAHLTATMLSGFHPLMHYTGSQIYIAPYGAGKSGLDVSLGSLDLLESQIDLAGFVNLATQIGPLESTHSVLKTQIGQVDLCIMNPPYTRNTNHEGGRAADPLPAFAAFNISRDVQKAMARKLKRVSKGTFADGNAGMASYFLALADKMVKDHGVVAIVLPLTFLTGSSWLEARVALAKRYSNIIVVTVSGLHDKELGFSADTGMAECLLVARKEPPSSSPRAVMVSLDQRPVDGLSATLLAECITALVNSGKVPRLEDAPNGGMEIKVGGDRLGTLISIPLDWSPVWVGARVADYSLVQAAYHLVARGLVRLPGVVEHVVPKISVVPLAAIAVLGPLHRDISGKETDKEGCPRGPFDVERVIVGEEPTYPVLWGHEAARECTLEFEPDCKAVPRADADEQKLVKVVASATHLHVNLDWQFNSQPLQAQWTPRPAIGGVAWPSVRLCTLRGDGSYDLERERLESIALLLWLNSTPGILIRWLWCSRQQDGRGRLTREVLVSMPVLDVRQLSEEQLVRCENLFRRLRYRKMLPVHELLDDPVRTELDAGLLGDVLGWPSGWFEAHSVLDLLRRKLAAEPSIHGHKRR